MSGSEIVWRVTHLDGSRTVYGSRALAVASARGHEDRIEELVLDLQPSPITRELKVLQGLSSSRGSDSAIEEAQIELVRLHRIESAARLAYGWLWHATTNDPTVRAAREVLRLQLDRDGMKRGIRSAKDEGAHVDGAALEAQLMRGIE